MQEEDKVPYILEQVDSIDEEDDDSSKTSIEKISIVRSCVVSSSYSTGTWYEYVSVLGHHRQDTRTRRNGGKPANRPLRPKLSTRHGDVDQKRYVYWYCTSMADLRKSIGARTAHGDVSVLKFVDRSTISC